MKSPPTPHRPAASTNNTETGEKFGPEMTLPQPIIIDCQSTGASPTTSALLELAWNDHAYVVQTTTPPSKKILVLTGIAPQELAEAVSSLEVFQHLDEFIKTHQPPYAVAHFARFEKVFLDRLWQEHAGQDFPLPWVCTHRLAKLLHPDLPTHGLRALAGWYGDPLCEHKRALGHVQATGLIWQGLTAELQTRRIATQDELFAFLETKPPKAPARKVFQISRERRLTLPNEPGIYQYIGRNGKILYVGKATSLKHRVNSYFTGGCRKDHRKREMLAQAVDVQVTPLPTPLHAGLKEYDEIQRLQPPYNKMFRGSIVDLEDDLAPLLQPLSAFDKESLQDLHKRVFYDLSDGSILHDGITQWRARHGIAPETTLTYRQFIKLGLPLLKQWILAEKERIAAEKAALEDKSEEFDKHEEEVEEQEETEFVWTTELVTAACDAWTRRAAREYIRTRYLQRLHDATIAFDRHAILPESERPFDVRRTKVLLHELRRIESRGGTWQVVKPWPMQIPFWI